MECACRQPDAADKTTPEKVNVLTKYGRLLCSGVTYLFLLWLEGIVMRTLAKMTFGGVVAALLVLLGPAGYEKVAKMFQPLPLSPLAKVVLEKLDTAQWTIQQDGISCDTLWIRGETDSRNPKQLNSDELKSCSVFVRQGGLSKELASHAEKIIKWMEENSCMLVLSDGDGMYYITKSLKC